MRMAAKGPFRKSSSIPGNTIFRELGIPSPAYNLGVGAGSHGQQTGRMLEAVEQVIERENPRFVVVYGDTNSTVAGALVAAKLRIPIAHVEAGLRSFNRGMPEEINRVVTDHLSTLLFCPTQQAERNLASEGLVRGVRVVGDVMYDSVLYYMAQHTGREAVLQQLDLRPREYALATIHRAEATSKGDTVFDILEALGEVGMPVVLPLHPRTRVTLASGPRRTIPSAVHVIDPVGYHEMLSLERHARLILTDSGGVQKEAFMFKVPCVTLRDETEWGETVDSGWNQLAGTSPERILAAVKRALSVRPAETQSPYGDGHAAERIVECLSQMV